ncbi:hypothetical protein A2Z22_01240 [Candidatus Woesebacteria bacterium RBG_16_34_12]|uniref:Peptidase S51 dipeptidase E n=1 Tax=Candidatus Woesebacteria bacterium RBG_16_34_12 TaxID=1802480 RepID=A0A1F7X8M9_9BACT|nr:MAG: hypothetical protein A2Z22_01240 [Candidatus Woesebacteria bacterium RBG_16_34_12]
MKRIVLFSTLTENNTQLILNLTFPKEITDKVLAYMPSDGANCPQEYVDKWRDYAEKYHAEFLYIDNSKENAKNEISKLLSANILVITGGNTFQLLFNLKKSGLFNAIKKFTEKNNFVISGFSAGALVLTPTINVCNLPNYDNNLVGLKDLTGLNLVNFEVFPHYSKKYKSVLERYKKTTSNEVKEISEEGHIVLEI